MTEDSSPENSLDFKPVQWISSSDESISKRRSQISRLRIQSFEFIEVDKDRLHEDHVSPPGSISSTEAGPSVSLLSEKLRKLGAGSAASQKLQCSLFCGGKNCKHENIVRWTGTQTAISGVFCHW